MESTIVEEEMFGRMDGLIQGLAEVKTGMKKVETGLTKIELMMKEVLANIRKLNKNEDDKKEEIIEQQEKQSVREQEKPNCFREEEEDEVVSWGSKVLGSLSSEQKAHSKGAHDQYSSQAMGLSGGVNRDGLELKKLDLEREAQSEKQPNSGKKEKKEISDQHGGLMHGEKMGLGWKEMEDTIKIGWDCQERRNSKSNGLLDYSTHKQKQLNYQNSEMKMVLLEENGSLNQWKTDTFRAEHVFKWVMKIDPGGRVQFGKARETKKFRRDSLSFHTISLLGYKLSASS